MCCINTIVLSLLISFQIGKSKLFFHEADLKKMDQISNKVKEKVIVCQSGRKDKVQGVMVNLDYRYFPFEFSTNM